MKNWFIVMMGWQEHRFPIADDTEFAVIRARQKAKRFAAAQSVDQLFIRIALPEFPEIEVI